MKKNEILPLATTGVDLGILIPSEINQRKRNVVLYRLHVESKVKVRVKSLSCVRLCDPVDCSPPGSSIHGILQARILEWVAISFSRGSSQPRSPALQADALTSEPPGRMWNPKYDVSECIYKTEADSQPSKTDMVTKGEKWGRDKFSQFSHSHSL